MYKDLEKMRAAKRRHYHANKQQYLDRNAQQRQRNQQFLLEYLQQNCCIDCGESDVRCLEFDHTDRELKVSEVGKMAKDGVGLDRIKAEIDKCVVRCANCHRKRTAEQFGWYKNI